MSWREVLCKRLLDSQPGSVCALDIEALAIAAETLPQALLTPPDAEPTQPCTLALGVGALDGLDAAQAQQLIHHVRLYRAPRLLLVARADCALDAAAFLALGFEMAAYDTAAGVRLHAFDLDTYKPVPDWLNSRFWANPERWEP